MATTEYFVGQRWVSNTEAELGLGIVSAVEGRQVTFDFPAVEELRTYAGQSAPVSRVIYPVGDLAQNNAGVQFRVDEHHDNQGNIIYFGTDLDGEPVVVPESELESAVQFSRPNDRLLAGQIDKLKFHKMRLDTLEHHHRQLASPVFGLLGGRVQTLPHQFYIANQVSSRHAPRVLLADEVGLGKTIEAGLILLQQLISGRASRVLITVPDSLLYQWLVEMLRRFNLRFTLLDELRCTAQDLSDGGNAFESAQLVLCSQSFLANSPERHEQAMAAGWDLMIVDEAHHLDWNETAPSHLYTAIEALAQIVPGVLLLTATPEQLGVDGHFARLRLLDPDRYSDLESFKTEETDYKAVSDLVETLQAEGRNALVDEDFAKELADKVGASLVAQLETVDEAQEPSTVRKCLRRLLDQHGTGRVLFRNTRAAVEGFPQRVLQTYPLDAPEGWLLPADAPLEHHLQPEKILGSSWIQTDSRVTWLESWLKEHRYEKTLLICSHKQTAIDLEEFLRLRMGVRCAAFHESMSLINRDRAAAYFADQEDGAQVLVCSEIGSEGRNFQFAQNLVMFDLPRNPDLLEQRIGRLDRIGQQHDVAIHVPFYTASAQEVLLGWFDEGLGLFDRPCAAASQVYGEFQESLEAMMQDFDPEGFATLVDETAIETERLMQILHEGRDRLLELNSCEPMGAQQVLEDVESASDAQVLRTYMERVFDNFGLEQQNEGKDSLIVHLTDKMLYDHFPGLSDEGATITFSRDEALSREDMQFMTWEHPMVLGAMDQVLTNELGNTAVCKLKLPPLNPGTILVEAVFTLETAAPKYLQLNRYLPSGLLRVLVDSNGNDLSKVLTRAHLDSLGERVPLATAQSIARHARSEIQPLIEKAEGIAEPEREVCVSTALDNAEASLSEELERLEALAKVNPNIRQEEIEQLRAHKSAVTNALSSAQLRLDAVRVAVVSD